MLIAFIYAAMAFYGLSAASELFFRFKRRQILFVFAFSFSAAAWFLRWVQVGHIPLQTMFEIFLALGTLIGPMSFFCRKSLNMRDPLSIFADGLLGLCLLFPVGFIFSEDPRPLPPALQSWLFGPHVVVYMLAYVLLAKAAVQAAGGLSVSPLQREKQTYKLVCLAFPLLTFGLILGSIWGKIAWGDWWGWDPKELWSLACWLIYVAYFHWRALWGTRFVKINMWMVLLGFAAILCTLLWVNLSGLFTGLHNYAG